MVNINKNFSKLQNNYLFSSVNQKVSNYTSSNPNAHIISLGIGDVSLPLPQVCINAIHSAADEMGNSQTFKGYGPEQGYEFLREKISKYDFKDLNISPDEIFISDGAKCDISNIVQLFDIKSTIAITDPVYPVYLDSNVIYGRGGEYNFDSNFFEEIVYIPLSEENCFVPQLPKEKVDIIYLCSPNNPTGTVLDKTELSKWVNYALCNKCIILFDSAYESFITNDNIPHSIYEIENAKKVAIEFRSFSKTAGFTGLRCAFTVIPKELYIDNIPLIQLYKRFKSTTFNGVSYITQKAAEAIYSFEGQNQITNNISYYLYNAKLLKDSFEEMNFKVYGGTNSPYLWIKTLNNMRSWDLFDYILEKANVVVTPGVGFGKNGENFFRITAFNTLENTLMSIEKIKKIF